MIPIIRWTLWQKRWYIFWWTIGVAAYMALIVVAYPPFRDQAATFNNTFNQLPSTVKSLVADTDNFFSPVGYLSSNAYYLMLPIVFSVLSIGLGSSLIARDEQDHTLELILSRPVSRGAILAGRALAAVCVMVIVTLFTAAVTILFAAIINLHIPLVRLLLVTAMSMRLAAIFGALAYLLTSFGKAVRVASIGIATLLLIASYLFTSLSGTVHWLRWPAKVLPYHYYHPSEILNGTSNWHEAVGMTAAILVLVLLSYVGFRRRDIS
jgi:beta-exotoxin I transport system permease protein